MKLETYQQIVDDQLTHRGHRYEELARQYNTPLYLFDETSFRDRIKSYQQAIATNEFETEILYASKALLTLEIARIIAELGLGQDVVSAGEIYAGQTGGVSPEKMYFHGNNKTNEELLYAIEQGVGTIVLDNVSEAQRLSHLLTEQAPDHHQKVLLRVNPGISAHTHEYIVTATDDSKFGENIHDPQIIDKITQIIALPQLHFAGLHSHIGSQIFEEDSFLKAAHTLIDFASEVQMQTKQAIVELNFGGGFGVYYTEGDEPFDVKGYLPKFVKEVARHAKEKNLKLKRIAIEPGRSLVNASGSTLYRVGDIKQTVTGKEYLFIDGGMTDNIRPALYQAHYEGALVNKITQLADKHYTVAGKACESGDKIISDLLLPQAETDDLLLVNGTGAYNFSMASNYNYIPRPAMVHITDQTVKLTVKRDTFEDLIRNQI